MGCAYLSGQDCTLCRFSTQSNSCLSADIRRRAWKKIFPAMLTLKTSVKVASCLVLLATGIRSATVVSTAAAEPLQEEIFDVELLSLLLKSTARDCQLQMVVEEEMEEAASLLGDAFSALSRPAMFNTLSEIKNVPSRTGTCRLVIILGFGKRPLAEMVSKLSNLADSSERDFLIILTNEQIDENTLRNDTNITNLSNWATVEMNASSKVMKFRYQVLLLELTE